MTVARRHVHVVTDSTASLPPALAERLGITVVPLSVMVDGVRHLEGVDLTSAQLLGALRDGATVTTSQPSPEQLADAYRDAVVAGAQAIVSVHLSAELSGTVQAAELAARGLSVPVHVVDSRSVAMGLGLAALAAVDAATDVDRARQAAAEARRVGSSASARFLVDSLDALRRGGRLGATAAALGTVLGMRPLLGLRDGRLEIEEKVRTRVAARVRLEELTVQDAVARGRCRVAVHHLGDLESANALAERLTERLGSVLVPWPGEQDARVVVSEASAVIGAHVGPGLLAAIVGPGPGAGPGAGAPGSSALG